MRGVEIQEIRLGLNPTTTFLSRTISFEAQFKCSFNRLGSQIEWGSQAVRNQGDHDQVAARRRTFPSMSSSSLNTSDTRSRKADKAVMLTACSVDAYL
jgi:hypothetical protein